MEIVIASANVKKVHEISQILTQFGVKILIARDLGFTDEIEETGTTFAENAMIKAKAVCKALNMPAIADDSGLCVDALDCRPGVYSARYAENDEACIIKLLGEMSDKTNRNAHFVSSIALVFPNGDEILAEGKVFGEITHEKSGENGFGYDPIFRVPEYNKTFAEINSEIKNKISHRANALNEFYNKFKEYKGEQ